MQNKDSIFTTQFWLLCASSVLFMGSYNMIIPELPSYLDSIGGEDFKGLIIGLFAGAALLSRPFSGRLADTVGRIPVMVIGPVVCVLLGLLYPLTSTIAGFLLLRFFHGLSTGFKPTGTTAYLTDIVPAGKRGEAMGILGVSGSIGMAAGPALGSWIATEYSMDLMFWISSMIAALSIMVLLGMKESLEPRVKFKPSLLIIRLNEILETQVWLPSLIMLLTVFAFGNVLTVAPDNSDYLGLDNRGIFFSIMLIASIVTRLFSGKASDKLGRVNVLIFGTFSLFAANVILGLFQSKTGFFMGAIVFGISAGINSPTIFAWTADLAYEKARGKAMSTLFIALELGIVLGSIIGAELYNNDYNQLPYAYWGSAILAFVAFVVMLIKKKSPLST